MFTDSRDLLPAVHEALASALSLSGPEADLSLFRSYADPPPVNPPLSRNVCYYDLQTDPQAPQLQEKENISGASGYFSFIPCRLNLVFYGPSCESWAHRCRLFLFQDGHGLPLSILRAAGLFPVPYPRPPAILYEELAKTHRKRADLVVDVRLADHFSRGSADESVPVPDDLIKIPPVIILHPER